MKATSNKIRTDKKSNVLYISSYKKRNVVKAYTKTDDDWYDILRANDAYNKVSFKAARLVGKLILEAHKNNDRSVFKDNYWFSKILKVSTAKQNARIRNQINHIFNFHFHKRLVVDQVLLKDVYEISFTEKAYKILNFEDTKSDIKNSEENTPDMASNKSLQGDKNVSIHGHKCPSYMYNKEIEIDPYGISISISNNEKLKIKSFQESKSPPCAHGSLNEPAQVDFSHNETRASKETELAEQTKPNLSTTPTEATTIQLTPNYQEPNQLQYPRLLTAKEEKTIHQGRMARTDENTGVSSFAELMSKVLSNPEQETTQEEIAVMKQEELSLIPDKETNKMLLSKAIFNSFGERSANEIQDNCEFEELAFDKVAIKPASGVSFNDIEKAKIRKCIQSVYGEDVKLVAIQTQLVKLTQIRPETKAKTKADEPVNQSMPAKSETVNERITQNQQWLHLRAELTKALLKKHREEKYAQHILKNWFDKLQVSTESSRDKLILISSSFVIGWINDNYLHSLEQAVLASNFIVELRDDGNQERPIILTKEMINRGK